LRDQYGADLVSLWVEGTDACGVAYVMTNPSTSFESSGFSVVERSCATGYYSFGHEMGHNMGSKHDIYVDSNNGAYSYSHGYADPMRRFRTVMAYNNACSAQGTSCTRYPYWSNPEVQYSNQPCGDYAVANNTMSLDNTAPFVANFRATKVGNSEPTEPAEPPPVVEPPAPAPLPDLTGTWTKFSVYSGRYFYTTLKISNVGTAPAGYSKVSYYRSTDGKTLSQLLKTFNVSSLNAGSSISGSYNFSFSSSIRGQYIIAVVDAGNSVNEADETNNRVVYRVY
jgi:hypothetical protein